MFIIEPEDEYGSLYMIYSDPNGYLSVLKDLKEIKFSKREKKDWINKDLFIGTTYTSQEVLILSEGLAKTAYGLT